MILEDCVRIAAVVAVLSTVAVAVRVAAPDASTRGDLRTWFQSALSLPEGPSPRGFENIVSRVKPAVFGIRAKVTDETASTDDQEPGFLPRFGETPDDHQSAPEHPRATTSQGSGFFISTDGYALTANHVIEHGRSIAIETDDGNTYPARLVASDPQSDIALLKVLWEIRSGLAVR
jgi:serine protease Do